MFYKLPQKDGEAENVGIPLTKTFFKYAQDAGSALSAHGRVLKQMVIWQRQGLDMGMAVGDDPYSKASIILPQVITMGTVTRHAIERTLLTVSNAKKKRVGSELKSMVTCASRLCHCGRGR